MNRISKKTNFTTLSNVFLRDNNISFKAKGLFAYMFSMSDGWNFTIKSISSQQKEGEDSIRTALNELKDNGYIIYEKHSDGSGTYHMQDKPELENPNLENPIMGKSNPIKKEQLTKNKNTYASDAFTKEQLEAIISYRSKIRKPIKTQQAVTGLSNCFKECYDAGYMFEEIFELMQEKQWQTIKLEWVSKETRPSNARQEYTW